MKYSLSVILPVYNEEKNIDELYSRIKRILEGYGSCEMIFVNDGSTDKSFDKISELSETDNNVKIINFSRNFGQQIALTAGIDHSSSEAVITMDCDLQDPPEIIPQLVEKWKQGSKIVYAKRKTRKDSFFKKMSAYFFYRFFRMFSDVSMPYDVGDFRLIDRRVIKEIKKMREHSRFMRGMVSWVGFPHSFVYFDREKRRNGKTTYSFRKMMRFAVDAMTSFSYVPLKLSSYLGIFSAAVGFFLGLFVVYIKLFLPAKDFVSGWASITVAILFVGGIQLLILGVIGEYLGKIYTELKNRPLYIVSDKINLDSDEEKKPE